MTVPELVLANVRLADGRIADISIADGRVIHVGSSDRTAGACRIECGGRLCVPAATDMHVHMRDGAQKAKEDWATGTMAAVAGGVSTVVDQPNTVPPMESAENFRARVALAAEQSFCRFAINGSVTEAADFPGLAEAGALAFGEMFAAPSSYGTALSPEVIRSASATISALGKLLTVHAEEVRPGDVHTLAEHAAARPAAGEVQTIRLVAALVPKAARLHFCHLSSVASFAAAGASASFEVAPHHLFLSYEDAAPKDTHMRMNPPLRSRREQRELFAAFDRIPVIASDHAPHTLAEKAAAFSQAPSGVPGVETMLPLLMNCVDEKKFSLASVLSKTVTNPNKILGIESPAAAVGARADFAVYADKPVRISAENLHSKCGWTPYEGMSGLFPVLTVIGGRVVWRDGEFSRGAGEWIKGEKLQQPKE
ncbi:MAG: dihydroorotase [Methanocorpusculum sp.]|nr:dihydroorotase [Methanocorpusculum sp.]